MMNIEFVRAGAGSGKTYYLTQLLASRLENKTARASAVLATTFTVKAAMELRERARTTLLESGNLDLAAAIGQARIGTINSVCGQLIQRFCFELGVSPEQQILDEQQTSRVASIALESVQTPNEIRSLIEVARRLDIGQGDFSSKGGREQKLEQAIVKTLRELMAAARENSLSPEQLAAMGAKNAHAMLSCWPAIADGLSEALDAELEKLIPQLEAAVNKGKPTGVLQKAFNRCRDSQQQLREGRLPWSSWEALAKLNAGAPQRQMIKTLQDTARRHGSHRQFHADVELYLELMFDIASRGMAAYEQAKREMGVVDFTDQEVLLLRGLKQSNVMQQALREELDLVLVDEFQDTNPLQLAIFIELAKLAKSSVWVGDRKQAIYGFRGTDSTLIQQVLDSVEDWGGKLGKALTDSWRSTPALVKLANEAFVAAFSPTPAADIALTSVRDAIADSTDMQTWTFETPPGKRALDVTGLGPALAQLLQSDTQVFDKETKTLRRIQPNDIAILCRTNPNIKSVVKALGRWGIPVAAERPGLLATPEAQLVVACLRRLHDSSDTVASAVITGLTQALEPEQWINDRLSFLADAHQNENGEWEPRLSSWRVTGDGASPLLSRLDALRGRLLSLTPFEALRLAKAESGVVTLCYSWAVDKRAAQVRIANVEKLLSLGRQYEDECLSSGQPGTVNGLLLWLQKLDGEAKDGRAAASHGAVEVMTFHGSKGLEWPIVVIVGLDHAYRTDLWQVRARTDGEFDVSVPLANRFVHYWPYPYGASESDETAAAEATQTGETMAHSALEENCRLLYVSLTRARDQIILVSKPGSNGGRPPLNWLNEANAANTFWPGTAKRVIDGVEVVCTASHWTVEQTYAQPPEKIEETQRFYPSRSPVEHPPLWVKPSAVIAPGYRVHTIETIGTRIEVRPHTDFALLGTALHNCIACATADPTVGIRLEEVTEILNRWGVGTAIDPRTALDQVNAFSCWWKEKWPQASAISEIPFEAKRVDGSISRGQIDLLLSVAGGRILFDHKSDPRGVGSGDRLALTHGGQLAEYAQAIEAASGEPVLERWLFLPVSAQAIRIIEG